MTVKEVMDQFAGQFEEVEIYKYNSSRRSIHTDFIDSVDNDDVDMATEVRDFELMDELEYNQTINANNMIKADFDELFDDADAKILVIILDGDKRLVLIDGRDRSFRIVGLKNILSYLDYPSELTAFEAEQRLEAENDGMDFYHIIEEEN